MKILRKPKFEELLNFDREYKSPVIGTDEAGRGPLAGPVVAAAVYFPVINEEMQEKLKYIDDSKKISSNPALRKIISDSIKTCSVYSIAECSIQEIDKLNILHASLTAMMRACDDVISKVGEEKNSLMVLVDGKFIIPRYKFKQKPIVKGDSVSLCIAAASILAKVYRDEIMETLSKEFPIYGWHQNKGYPTASHINAIQTHGPCDIHRKIFLGKIMSKQKSLFDQDAK